MITVSDLLLSTAVILNHIGEISNFECLPDGAPIPGIPRGGHFDFPEESSPVRSDVPPPSFRLSPPAGSPRRFRSRSPSYSSPHISLSGQTLEELSSVRLIPHRNPKRIFEVRRYTFPQNKSLLIRVRNCVNAPIPAGEHTVLATSNGDVFATLEKNNTYLRGIYRVRFGSENRVKINMYNGKVEEMSTAEIQEILLTKDHPILKNFLIIPIEKTSEFECSPTGAPIPKVSPGSPPDFLGESPPVRSDAPPHLVGVSRPAETSFRSRSRSPSGSRANIRLSRLTIEELSSVRLIPHKNPNRIFEIQRYNFPQNASLLIRGKYSITAPMPDGEHTVLATSNGDAYATLERNNTFLRGIYKMRYGCRDQVKVNMYNGEVKELTTAEVTDCPLTKNHPISKNFKIKLVDVFHPRHQ